MLGYIYSAIALFTGTAKGYCGKKISEFTNKISDAIHMGVDCSCWNRYYQPLIS